jgi:hypothetical protein
MQELEVDSFAISRRTLVLGSAAAVGSAALAVFAGLPLRAFASVPATPQGVIALARSYLGMRLSEIRPLTGSPWNGYPDADWCAWFVSWVTRGLGHGYQTFANAWDGLPHPTTPQVGDFARISTGTNSAIHIGIVTQINPIRIIDGNRIRGSATYYGNSYVREEGTYDPITFRRPTYGTAQRNGTSDMLMIMKGTTPNYTFALFAPTFWYEWTGDGSGVANTFASQISGGAAGAARVTEAEWNAIKAEAQRVRSVTVAP